ncbi:MAG: NAD(P)H-quinone oxidoreductase [Hyphomicrobiales bacterium]
MSETPAMMKAVEITEPGGPDVLVARDVATPHPEGSDILIRVKAAGINRPDILQRKGLYPAPKDASPLPGLEVAGIVEAVGRGASKFKIGDEVCALTPGGGYAEFCLVDETNTLLKPKGLSFEQAACVPETFFTVWHNVFERGGLGEGEVLLVHGGASGIGTTAIQLGKAFGATVIATAGNDEKCQKCRDLGADLAINYNADDYVAAVKEFTGKKGANVILDMVGGDYIERNYSAAAPDGRIVQIAFLNGAVAEVNFTKLMLKRLTHTGSTLRARSVAVKAGIANELEAKVWPLLEAGTVGPVMDSSFALDQANEAHKRMESSGHFGKIVLTV